MRKESFANWDRSVRKKLCVAGMMAATVLAFSCELTAAQTTDRAPAGTSAPAQPGSSAQTPSTPAPPQSPAAEQSPAQKYFTDVVLLNQNGEKMRFYSDLLHGKVVIINSFFATCKADCLPMSRNLEKLQEALGDRVGKDVYIVSISVDSTVDTPPALKEYAKKYHAGPGWYFLTGDKQNVEFALKKLGFLGDKQDHLNIFIIGNERTGLWKKAFGLAQSDELVKVVESVLNDQPPGGK